MPERPIVTVGALIVASDGDILLVRSKKWSDFYSLPGGKVEWGETREAAVRREILEETGLCCLADIKFAIVQDCIFSPLFWQKKHFVMNDFIAYLDPNCSKEAVHLNDEAYEYQWISPEQALLLPLHQECRFLIEWYLKQNEKKGLIGISHHRISCVIGILPEERIQAQDIYVDVKVKTSFVPSVQSDCISKTVNYVDLAQICTELAQKRQYYLLETFASEALNAIFSDSRIEWAWIKVKKPQALSSAEYTFVELERYR
jgi:dihydroneopterin aldolase